MRYSQLASECDGLETGDLPVTDEYLQSLSTAYIVGLGLCILMTAVVVCSYTESALFLVQHYYNWRPKDKALQLLGLYPIFCITSAVALIVPRSATLNDMVAQLYLAGCVYSFVVMLMGHFGGQEKMSKRLIGTSIPLQSPPFCCCCVCLPALPITTYRLWVLEMTVLQYAILKPILAYLAAVLWADDRFVSEDLGAGTAYTWINVISIISTLIALYGFMMIYQMSIAPLEKMCVKPKFLVLQLVLILSNFQHVVISFLVLGGLIPCDPPLTAKANGDRWHHMLLITEMCILSFFARMYYRRHMEDLPSEEQIFNSIADQDTMTTDSLGRGQTLSSPYGAVDVSSSMEDTPVPASPPPLVLLNRHSNSSEQQIASFDKYRSRNSFDIGAHGTDANEVVLEVSGEHNIRDSQA